MTHPSVLAVGAYAVQPGPILRGVHLAGAHRLHWSWERRFRAPRPRCRPTALAVESTNRERTAAATAPPTCVSCHRRINPPGFAFEHYDALGAWRARDNGQPVDASGSLTLPGGETLTFADGIDFVHQLATSDRVRDCYALHWTRYALGDRIEAATPGLDAIQRGFREEDSIGELLVSIARSDLFRTGATADAPGDTR